MTDQTTPPAGFSPPPYPYDRLTGMRAAAESLFGTGSRSGEGVVDCSVGTPNDPPPASALEALARSGTERGYPASPGSLSYRQACARWLDRQFGVRIDPTSGLAACVGTKELVASTAHYLRLRSPDRDVVLYPEVSYPTYAMGARLAGCRAVPVPERPGGGLALETVPRSERDRALLVWVNSPSNPTGRLTDLAEAAAWGRGHGIPVFSDECYAPFTWDGPPRSILEAGVDGVVAVHSLSKRSNLAGVRAGFFAGDPALVGFLLDIRRHAGLMVPGPVQAAAVAALEDEDHVEVQRGRYLERLVFLRDVLGAAGLPVALPDGGFYLWVPVPDSRPGSGWGLAEDLARVAGILTSPGDLYGEGGARFVRVAVVQPMDRLALVADRLAGHDLSRGRSDT